MPFDASNYAKAPDAPVLPEESQLVKDLRAARALLEDESRWHQGGICDATGRSVCAVGALYTVIYRRSPIDYYSSAWKDDFERAHRHSLACRVLSEGAPNGTVPFNDDRMTKHADILALFDCAIELARGK